MTLINHIIPLNEHHLRRLGRDYLGYYHDDRTHIGLNKGTPANRLINNRPTQELIFHLHRESVVFIIGTAGQKQRD